MSLIQQALLIGAWIGLVHAFDADHISTLSSLAVRGRPRSALGYAARWACGHAVAIGALGVLALGVGLLWIPNLSHFAEMAVAALLMALGVNAVASAWRREPANAAPAASVDAHRHRTGLLMGLLHGGAGSAAVLAILPLAGFDSAFAAIGFLLTFSVGVAAGALLFAALFSGLLARTRRGGRRLSLVLATIVGLVAVFVGGSMLLGTLNAGPV
jgi:hypothetical protein